MNQSQKQKQPRSFNSVRKPFGSELLAEERSLESLGILTFCRGLDELIGNGVRPGTITELVGDKGVGKTTLCLQLCLDVQLPTFMNGLDSEAVFINTEHSLSPVRLMEMTAEFVAHCNKVIDDKNPYGFPYNKLNENEVLSRIHIINCFDADELSQMILGLQSYLKENSKVKLIVIDSIAFPMYSEEETFYKRSRMLYSMVQILFRIINQYGAAVVLTNNMTTRFADGSNKEYCIPFLGESWNHVPNQRILLSVEKKVRKAELIKSSFCPLGSANYIVIASGFRDP